MLRYLHLELLSLFILVCVSHTGAAQHLITVAANYGIRCDFISAALSDEN
jgi:hypothetical protein